MNPSVRSLIRNLAVPVLAVAAAAAEPRFPFVIPGDDASPSVTNLSALSARPAGADGFVRIRDGRFHTEAGRLRFWGVNTCFGGNYPAQEEAGRIAAHLAKLGVNAIRIHHHDTQAAPRGIWGPVVDGRRTLAGEQVARFDRFLAELHRHGIYANLNLHVGREVTEAEGFPREGLPYSTRYDKYLLYFEPVLQARLKEFCRDYLLHFNPERGRRRVDDPGIALIEITNENSFSKLGPGIAASLPEPHRGEFKRQWNVWLARQYQDTAALRAAWGGAREPLGPPLADSVGWREGLGPWKLKQSREHPLRVDVGQAGPQPDLPALRLQPGSAAGETSAQELQFPNLRLEPGQVYTLSFWARAEAPRSVFVDVSNAGPSNWNPVGFRETLDLTPAWQRVHRVFRTSATIPGAARICFKFGGSPVALALAGLTLRRGGDWVVVPEGQTLEARSIEIPVAGWSEPAQRDVVRFMAETEEAFLRDMMAYLKRDLGVKVPITASQITYHTPRIVAATCDYADIHSYWQHPRFPRKPWDPVDWEIRNTPMERSPEADAMLARAPWRLLDRPFTMSEWNIPDPHDYAASVVPFAAVIAALQDWDGIFFFQYHSNAQGWTGDRVSGFFSFNGQPVKLALLTALAPMFLRGDLAPLAEVTRGTLDQLPPATAGLSRRIGIDPRADRADPVPAVAAEPGQGLRLAAPGNRVVWDARTERAHVLLHTAATRGCWGLVAGGNFQLDQLRLKIGETERNYAVVIVTSLDGAPLEQTRRALLVAVGSAANPGMKWNASRTSVGRDWGSGPSEVNGIPLEVSLPRGGARLYALDGRGQRLGEVRAVDGAGAQFRLGPEQRTLWYEIEW
ncbi:MAG: hypothetical protein HZC55_08155 [Verrucomicrobia bacterium]|nr:hypothetical protein [Verrucomicrobiota bacterium]